MAELEAYRARGLFGAVSTARPRGGGWPPALPGFRCPDCGSGELLIGDTLARHPCPGRGSRPVAWRSFGGEIVTLSWWRRETERP